MRPYELGKVAHYTNFCEMTEEIGKTNKPAVTWYTRQGEEITKTYKELSADARAFAGTVAASGLIGKHIALAGPNCYEWIVAFLGITSAGAVAVLIDTDQSDESINMMIMRADAAALIAPDDILDLLQVGEGKLLRLSLDMDSMAEAEEKYAPVALTQPEPDATAVIAFTSGTTSFAKPVMLSQRGLLRNASDSVAMVEPTDRVFTSLPFFHTYGLTCAVLGNLIFGSHLCINGDIRTTFRDILAFDAETLMAVPLIAETVKNRLEAEGEKLRFKKQRTARKEEYFGRLTYIVCGGAHLSKKTAQQLKRYGILVLQGYGITECSPLVSANRRLACRLDSVGQLLPGVEVKFDEGEILVKSPGLMQGYYNDSALTAEAMDNGWFKTGDMGYMDKRGHLYITGRKKNLIVLKNGKKIAPEEIEQKLADIPIIKDVLVYGAASGSSADDVKLTVMVYPDPTVAMGMEHYQILGELQKYVDDINKTLPSYKQIQMINICENEMQKTSTRKIKRQSMGV